MTTQLMFYVDLNRCINCKSCEMACNEYYNLSGVHRRTVVSYETESNEGTVHFSISCNHCKNPVCVIVCPENNFQKRQDGIIVHNSSNCKSCKRCIQACPFHAPKLNPKTNRADKCNFCVERIDQGLKPVCVENCITGALSIMKVDSNGIDTPKLNTDIPIANYTNPSIFINRKQPGQLFLRKGCSFI
ncbi:4Fe-4S dicluster domain-containing protein [Neobacillus drentensis]|uniref:4Fe-4S dicluster domain-containing protein n=1 Tax=Neobacillus drentensis TaxID=220684 RepID=UPI002FFFB53C